MTWPLGLSSSKTALMSKPISNEGRKERSWISGQQTCPLTTYINIWTVSSDVSIQRRQRQPLSVQPKMWMMCEGWPHHRGLRPLLFSNSGVGSFTNHKNQISASAVRRDPRLFPRGGGGVLRPEVQPLTLLHTIFGEKGSPFVYLLLTNGTPFTYFV